MMPANILLLNHSRGIGLPVAGVGTVKTLKLKPQDLITGSGPTAIHLSLRSLWVTDRPREHSDYASI